LIDKYFKEHDDMVVIIVIVIIIVQNNIPIYIRSLGYYAMKGKIKQ